MVEASLEHMVDERWHGIAEIAEQLQALAKVRRAKTLSKADAITHLTQGIDTIDVILATNVDLRLQLDILEERISESDPTTDRFIGRIPEVRRKTYDQDSVVRTLREQLFSNLVHLNSEDAWAWTPEGAASLRAAEEAVAAGCVTKYESDEEFLAALERIHANAHA